MKTDRALCRLAGLAIVLVVLGHSGPPPNSIPKLLETSQCARFFFISVHGWIYTFHMPLFFLMAGYSYIHLSSAPSRSFYDVLKRKAARLLVPYVALSSALFPVKALLSRYANRPVSLSFHDYLLQLIVPWDNVILFYWFLPTLFLMFVFTHLLWSRCKSRCMVWIVFASSAYLYTVLPHENHSGWLSFFNLGGALHNYIFLWLGILLAKFNWQAVVNRYFLPLLPVSVIAYGLIPSSVQKIPCVSLCMAVVGMGGCWAVADRCEWSILEAIGNDSFAIYLLSCFPQILFSVIAGRLNFNVELTIAFTFVTGISAPLLVAHALKTKSVKLLQYACGV